MLTLQVPQFVGVQLPFLDCGRVTIGETKTISLELRNVADLVVELRLARPPWAKLMDAGSPCPVVKLAPDSAFVVSLSLNLGKEGPVAETLELCGPDSTVVARAAISAVGVLCGSQPRRKKLPSLGKAQRVLVELPEVSHGNAETAAAAGALGQQQPGEEEGQGAAKQRTPALKPVSCSPRKLLTPPKPSFLHLLERNSKLGEISPALRASSLDRQEPPLRMWLNSVLTVSASCKEEDGGWAIAGAGAPRAVLQLEGRMRGRLAQLCAQYPDVYDAMARVKEWLAGGRLKTPNAEAALTGVREQAGLRRALGSYHPLWLRLAAEVAMECPIAAHTSDAVVQHLVADSGLLARHKGARTAAYWHQLGALVAHRALLVILVLDRAAEAPPEGAPLLFRRRKAPGKQGTPASSEAVLQAALGPLLGESEVARVVGRLGYRVSHLQTPLAELDFSFANLAVDLRDGLRLCRTVDAFVTSEDRAKNGCAFDRARFPAARRPDRLHNVELALSVLRGAGLSLANIQRARGQGGLEAADVVDGDPEATTCLLWRMALSFQLPRLAALSQLRMEVEHLGGVFEEGGFAGGPLAVEAGAGAANVAALLQWVQAVAGKYGVIVNGFAEELADGRVFCLLVHHYLGAALMPLGSIFACPSGTSLAEAATGVRSNFELLRSAVASLGVPPLLVAEDFLHEGGADPRAAALFSAFLCRSLIECNREHRAAMTIQRRWRQRQGAERQLTPGEHLQRWVYAASVVQRCARTWLLRRGLRLLSQDRRQLERAVTRLQASWRAKPDRERFLRARAAAVTIQAAWRGVLGRQEVFDRFLAPMIAAVALRRHALLLQANQAATEHRTVTKLQAAWRRTVERRRFLAQREAAVLIQTAFRRYATELIAQHRREDAAMRLQAAWRGVSARSEFLRLRAAAATLQRHFRGFLARNEAAARREAVETIQRAARRFIAARRELAVLQTKRKMVELAKIMAQFSAKTAAAQRIQAAWRGHVGRQQHRALLEAKAVKERQRARREADARAVIASWNPVFRDRAWFLRARKAARMLQAAYRQRLAARSAAATTIQKQLRAFLAVRRLKEVKEAALVVQTGWRGYAVRAGHPDAGKMLAIRTRLRAALQPSSRGATLADKTRAALDAIAAARGRLPAVAALRDLARCTEASIGCSSMVSDAGAVPALLQGAAAAARDRGMGEACRWSLAAVGNVIACKQLPTAKACVEDDTSMVSLLELLQRLRERGDAFLAVVSVFSSLVADSQRAEKVERRPGAVATMQGVQRMLGQKRSAALGYLNKLEGQKGSDASAQQATKGLLTVSSQLEALEKVLEAVGAVPSQESTTGQGGGVWVAGGLLQGKNTKVREALRELTNGAGHISAR